MGLKFTLKYFYILLFAISSLVFLIHYILAGQAVYGDGIGYYAHLRSWVIENNLDTTNEYRHIYNPQNNNSENPKSADQVQIVQTNSQGKAINYYGTGVAMVLLPFFLLAHSVSILLSKPTSGYADIYQILSGLGAVFYFILGLSLIERVLSEFKIKHFTRKLVIFISFFSTHLFYYGSYDVINSHFASFYLSVLFVYVLALFKDKPIKHLILGLIFGFIFNTRIQDSAIAVLYVFNLLLYKKTTLNFAKNMLIFAISSTPFILFSIYSWQLLYDTYLPMTYLNSVTQSITQNRYLGITNNLTNYNAGLFPKAHIFFVALAYYIYSSVKKVMFPPLVNQLFIFFLLQFLTITLQGGWIASAYGGRMYISTSIFFMLCIGLMFQNYIKKNPFQILVTIGLLLISLNAISFTKFVLMEKEAESGKFGTEQRTVNRIQKLFFENN